MTEVQHVVGSVVEGGAFCRGANSSCNLSKRINGCHMQYLFGPFLVLVPIPIPILVNVPVLVPVLVPISVPVLVAELYEICLMDWYILLEKSEFSEAVINMSLIILCGQV